MSRQNNQTLWVATRKGLFELQRSQAGTWEISAVTHPGDNVSMVFADAHGSVYAALDHGHFGVKLQRSRDGGKTFAECACPAYPPKPEGLVDCDPVQQKPIPWTVMRLWSLEAGATGELLCGTVPGGLFRSRDGGDSWELVEALWLHEKRKEWFGGGTDYPGLHSICIDPRDPRRATVGVSCGGVWQTTDDCASWECRSQGMWAAYMPPERREDPYIQDPHRIVQCAAAPDVLWAQHHNGVFRSTDGASSWQEVTAIAPSGFGFAVAVHPRDPQVAWFIPALSDQRRIPVSGQVVVARTRDGGQSFTTLTRGLPQQHAYDIVYRHCLDVDASGDRLAFGSTTGSLWISEDQGDSFHHVAHHLPPIYCVRFGPAQA